MDHGEKKCKRHDLAIEKLQKGLERARCKWNNDRMKWLDLINKGCVKILKQGDISTTFSKQYLSTIKYCKTNRTPTT